MALRSLELRVRNDDDDESFDTYLTLPYHSGQAFYHLALRPLTGPMRIPVLTLRL